MFRLVNSILLLCLPFLSLSQEIIHFDTNFAEFVHYGEITDHNGMGIYSFEKTVSDKPFSIEVTYEGSECDSRLNSIKVKNSQFPLMWYEVLESGEKGDPIINPRPSQLKDHTTYIVQDFYFHSDTVYVDFTRSFEFIGVYPNPAIREVVLKYSAFSPLPAEYVIFDINGKLLFSGKVVFLETVHELILDPGDLKPGTYLLSLRCKCMNETIKLIYPGS